MRLSIISFTQNGYGLAGRLEEQLQGDCEEICVFTKFSGADPQEPAGEDVKKSKNVEVVTEPIARWAEEQMQSKNVLIFIGACGIAVRAIASSVKDKLTDSPVLVLDEKGRFVIPLLSGHVGGANALALRIAERIGAIPVITTATDINEKFAVDVFAQKNRFAIMNRDGIAKISAKVLAGETITISIDKKIFPEQVRNKKMEILFRQFPAYVQPVKYPPDGPVDILLSSENFGENPESEINTKALLYLKPKAYVIGVGCRRNTPWEKIEAAIAASLADAGIARQEVRQIASIDVKKDEAGILEWSRRNRVEYVTFPAEALMAVPGVFTASAFVKKQVGVDNVCERAAVLACDENARLIRRKQAYDGVTIAIARRMQADM